MKFNTLLIAAALAIVGASAAVAHPVDHDQRYSVQRQFKVKLGECVKKETRRVAWTYGSTSDKQSVCVAWKVTRSSNPRFPVGNTIYVSE